MASNSNATPASKTKAATTTTRSGGSAAAPVVADATKGTTDPQFTRPIFGGYTDSDAVVISLAPDKFVALLGLGLVPEEAPGLPTDPAEATRLVDELVNWLLANVPVLEDENSDLKEYKDRLNATRSELKERKQQVTLLLKMLTRSEERDDLRIKELASTALNAVTNLFRITPEDADAFEKFLKQVADLAAAKQSQDEPAAAPQGDDTAAEQLPPAEEPATAPVPVLAAAPATAGEAEAETAPLPTATLTQALTQLPDVDTVAPQLHANWVAQEQATGTLRFPIAGGENILVPFDELTEQSKQSVRDRVQAVYAAIEQVQVAAASVPAQEEATTPQEEPAVPAAPSDEVAPTPESTSEA